MVLFPLLFFLNCEMKNKEISMLRAMTSSSSSSAVSAIQSALTEMPQKDSLTYNAILSSLPPLHSFLLFLHMLRSHVRPTCHTLSILLSKNTTNSTPLVTHQLHAVAILRNLNSNSFVGSGLIKSYTHCNDVPSLKKSFFDIHIKNSVNWTVLIVGLMEHGYVSDAHNLFHEMPCPSRNTAVCTALINGFVKNADLESARKVFDEMVVERNVVTWTAMINGYAKLKFFRDGLSLYVQMCHECSIPLNPYTYSVVLTCVSGISDYRFGTCIHAQVVKHGCHLKWDNVLATSLVEMYGKCGDCSGAIRVFLECKSRNVAMWNAIIAACGRNGRAAEGVDFFNRMLGTEFRPDSITFVNVLSACAHGGLLEEGEILFEAMEIKFGVKRSIVHYGCLIDLYKKVGMNRQAKSVVDRMPMKADVVISGSDFDRRIKICGEREEWERVGKMKEGREREVGGMKGRGVSWVGAKL